MIAPNQKFDEAMKEAQQIMQKDTQELMHARDRLKKEELEVPQLKAEIEALKKQIENLSSKMRADERDMPRLKAEIHELEREVQKKHADYEHAVRAASQGARDAGLKNVPRH